MSITVGTLIVDLQANTASFVSGLDKAGQIALDSSKNWKRAFDAMATAALAALTGVEAAVAAMVDHALENAARLADMAQSTGTTVTALSALEFAAKQSGISTESLDKSLEKMAKSMAKAASQTETGVNAYKTLGVAVTDSTNRLRPTEDVLADLAKRFAEMPDGPTKTALAMQIFGKSGADMVPLLNRGKEGITELMEEAKRLGVAIDPETAQAAKKFEESMNLIKAAGEGAANKLAKELLPSLQLIADNIVRGAEDSGGKFQALIATVGVGTKAFIVAFSGVQTFFDSLGQYIQDFAARILIALGGIGNAAQALWNRDWSGLKSTVQTTLDSMTANNKLAADNQKRIWQEYFDGVKAFWNASPAAPASKGGSGSKKNPAINSADAEKYAAALAHAATELAHLKAEIIGVTDPVAGVREKFENEFSKIAAMLQKFPELTREFPGILTAVLQAENAAIDKEIDKLKTKADEAVALLAKEAAAANKAAGEGVIPGFAVPAPEVPTLALPTQRGQLDDFMNDIKAQNSLLTKLWDDALTGSGKYELEIAKINELAKKYPEILGLAIPAIQRLRQEEIHLYDEELLRFGGLRAGVQAFFNEYLHDGMTAARAVFEVFKRGFEGLEDNLAKLVTGQKTSFKQLFDDLEQQIAKFAIHGLIQKVLNSGLVKGLLAKFGIDLGQGKPDGTPGNPLHVVLEQGLDKVLGGAGGGAGGDASGPLGFISKLFGKGLGVDLGQNKPDGTEGNPFHVIVDKGLESLFGSDTSDGGGFGFLSGLFGKGSSSDDSGDGSGGGFWSSLLSFLPGFGGGKAGGGSVSPNELYMVGENGPEWFSPRFRGVVSPRLEMAGAGGGGGIVINGPLVHVVTPNADTFMKSEHQVANAAYGALARSAQRR